MTNLLVRTIADFQTTLTTKTSIGATTATLTSGLDGDGVQLPTGTYGFTIDRSSSSKEYFTATLTGTALTAIKTVTRGTGVGTSGLTKTHRKGAEVIISDHVAIKRMMDVLDGTTSFDSATPLGYDGTASITTANQIATKAYVDGVAIAGGADSSTTVKGITKMSVAPASATEPIAVGDNDGRVPTQTENDTLGAIVAGTDFYAASAVGTDSYAITISPAITAYATGMKFRFKADVGNTGACTLAVSGLSALAIKKLNDQDTATGDIEAGQIVEVVYDGTDFQMQSQIAQNPAFPAVTDIQTFTSTDTWTKPTGALKVLVQIWGGGGSGAAIRGTGGGSGNYASGGGGGNYIEQWFNASDITSPVTVTVGAGGVAVSGTVDATPVNGNNGANTTFGSYLTASFGSAGLANTSDTAGGAGGGHPLIGTLASWWGGSGLSGINSGGGAATNTNAGSSYLGGAGGGKSSPGSYSNAGGTSTFGGNGGASGALNGNGVAGSVAGGGGGGATGTNGNSVTSGAGGAGKAIVTTFF